MKALVFDVFGTVVDWRSGVARDAARLLGRGADGAEIDPWAFADAWRAHYAPSLDRVRQGKRPWAGLDTLHRESLDELLVEFGRDDVDEATRGELVLAWHRLDPWPDSVAGLERLKERFAIATLSNGNVSLLVDMARYARLPWDTVLSAELFGHYKPDAEVYDGAAALLGADPGETMMVAAHVDDLEAARARGMRTAYVHRPDEKGPGGTPPTADPDADVSVTSLLALADHLQC